ncbi:16S rRNA (adenine(1518)-N(6)/adenine(1519)-N(6))-dimethyltransferase RsmA [Bacteroidota bacterium]
MSVRPKKSLGQHFLRDGNIARKIVQSLEADPGGVVLEVGPGTGILSQYLFEQFPEVHLLEIDREAWTFLQERFPEHRDRIIHGDFLKFEISERFNAALAIIGNFPYNISSQIFFHILTHRQQVGKVVCMIQKEVADRIRSPHGSKKYGILSVLLQAFYDIEYLFPVGPKVFNPPPRVQSAVLRMKRNKTKNLSCDEKLFFRVVKAAFNHRRKTLRNSLKGHFPISDPGLEIFSLRPEQLSVERFVELTSLLETNLSS